MCKKRYVFAMRVPMKKIKVVWSKRNGNVCRGVVRSGSIGSMDSNDTPGMSSFSKFMLPEGQYVLHKEGAKI